MKHFEPKHFRIEELVSPVVDNEYGESAIMLFDDRILRSADAIRDYFGKPVTINNWASGGNRRYSGYRSDGDIASMRRLGTHCAKMSQHRFGRALDLIVGDIPAEEVRSAIIADRALFPGITRMEGGVDWVHIDCAPIAGDGIVIF